jgi:hypothetical protein
MSESSGSTSVRLTTADLLAMSGPGGDVTSRTLEFWRNQALLPPAERTGQDGTRPVWTYPAAAAKQLRALLRLRASSKDPNVLRAALWFEGYPVPTARVRESTLTWLCRMQEKFELDLSRRCGVDGVPEGQRWQAIQAIAREFAGKRQHGLPRMSRQTLADRTDAIAVMFGLLLGEQAAVERIDTDGAAAERFIGVDRGRRYRPNGVEPWIFGPPSDALEFLGSHGSLAALIALIETATDTELENARSACRSLLDGVAAFSRIADALAGRDNASGMAAIPLLAHDPHLGLLMPGFFLSIIRSPDLANNLIDVTNAITTTVAPMDALMTELAALPDGERSARLAAMDKIPFAQQLPIRRLLADYQAASQLAVEAQDQG